MDLLEIRDLRLRFETEQDSVSIVDGVSLSIGKGETLGLVGESGCGKSVTALSITRLLPEPPARYEGGQILLDGQDVLTLSQAELRRIRGRVVSYIFQEPGASLNPVWRVGTQIRETLRLHRPKEATDQEVIRWLQQVGVASPEWRARDFPHQLSGGLQQRVMIAMAVASRPALLVADEPTTALDVTIQAQIIDLLQDLQRQYGMSILLISHNLGLVARIAHRIAVMYAGQIVELGDTRQVLDAPAHPYTRALIRSAPELGRPSERLPAIPGQVPQPGQWAPGCRFAPRCDQANDLCHRTPPELLEIGPRRWVRCPYHEQ
ncbi:MAG: ABC transporter ATP-binding protein [Verrucomicrobiales bacterium]|nr:ABC transporter ATP-binding protein [Verrucomicrobiales bacterium]